MYNNIVMKTTTFFVAIATLIFSLSAVSAQAAPTLNDAPQVPWTTGVDQFTSSYTQIQDFAATVKPIPELAPFRGKGKAAKKAYNKLKKKNQVQRERTYERKLRDLDLLKERATTDIGTNNERRQISITQSYAIIDSWIDAAQETDERNNEFNFAKEIAEMEFARNSVINSAAQTQLDTVNQVQIQYNQATEQIREGYNSQLTQCDQKYKVTTVAAPTPLKGKGKKVQTANKALKDGYQVKNGKATKKRSAYGKSLDAQKSNKNCKDTAANGLTEALEKGEASAAQARDAALSQIELQNEQRQNEISYEYRAKELEIDNRYGVNIARPYDELRSQLNAKSELYQFRSSRQAEEENRITEDAYNQSKDLLQDLYDLVEDEDEDE